MDTAYTILLILYILELEIQDLEQTEGSRVSNINKASPILQLVEITSLVVCGSYSTYYRTLSVLLKLKDRDKIIIILL